MQKYNIFQALYMSFYSRKLYQDVAQQWGGKTFLYLLMLLTLSWIGFTYRIQSDLSQIYHKNSNIIVTQIPVITIQNGKVSTPENRPYIITEPDQKNIIAVIDVSGKYTTVQQANAPILLTQTTLISQTKPNEIRTYELPSTLNYVVDPRLVSAFIADYLGYAWIVIFIPFLLGSYIYRIFQALVYGIIGKVVGAIGGVQLSYGQIVQIMMVAITPVIFLVTIIDFIGHGMTVIPHEALTCFFLAMIYLFYGIFSNKK